MTAKFCTGLRYPLSMFCLLTATYCLPGYSDETTNEITKESSSAIGYVCKLGNDIRRIEIHYPRAPKTLPCEVIYHKDTESPDKPEILWRAKNDGSYCEMKADEMVYGLTTKSAWRCDSL